MTVLDTARSAPEAVFDCLLAGTLASWAVLALSASAGPVSTVPCAIAGLHLAAAFHFAVRSSALRSASRSTMLACGPSIAIAGVAFALAAPAGDWPTGAEVLFAAGALLAVSSFCSLGRSFAILPALRPIATGGLYRFVRHPAYGGELMMVVACALSRPSAPGAAVAALAFPLAYFRIRAEEAILETDDRYLAYRRQVRFRLLPGVW